MVHKTEDILVSVIIPVYRDEEYLDECVESIVNQTHQNLEIILVDDGSPDRCGEMCDKWAMTDNRIVAIHKENGGLSSARNVGIDIAKGDFFVFIDDDDYVAHYMIETLLKNAVEYDADLVCSEFIYSNENSSFTKIDEDYNILELSGREMSEFFYFRVEDPIKGVAWNKLYKRSLFLETGIRFPEGKLYEDSAVIPRVTFLARNVVCINARLYCYRSRIGSIMRSPFTKTKCCDSVYITYSIVDFFCEYNEKKLLTGAYMYACRNAIINYANIRSIAKPEERRFCREYILSTYKTYRKRYKSNVNMPFTRKMLLELFAIWPWGISKLIKTVSNYKMVLYNKFAEFNPSLQFRP